MAALETERLVVRVVYAGAPLAGKTASVRALMPLLKGPGAERLVMSPGEERGRTQFFDWADYDGGSFQGRPIHCQIASAPGQVALSDRRELVLRGADAVILVVDSQHDGVERALQCYEEMAPWLEEAGQEAPIRLLLQCNKQDLPGALTPAQLSRALGLNFGKDVFATSARTSKGLRAAFVAAVRVAVERARVLLERGLILPVAEIASGEELLERMQIEAALRESDPPELPPAALSRPSSAAAAHRAEPARARRGAAVSAPSSAVSAPSPVRSSPRAASAPSPEVQRVPAGARAGSARHGRRVAADGASEAPASAREPSSIPEPVVEASPVQRPPARPRSERGSGPRLRASVSAAREAATRARDASPSRERELPERPPATARGLGEPGNEARGVESARPESARPEVARRAPPATSAGEQTPARSAPSHANPPVAAPNLARDWTPAKGARPAVMPASAFYERVSAPSLRMSGKPSSSPFNEPEPVSDDEWIEPTPDSRSRAPTSLSLKPVSSASRKSSAPQRSDTTERSGGTERSGTTERSGGTERSAAPQPRARLAIMPMSAYLASLPASAPVVSASPPSVPERPPESARVTPARALVRAPNSTVTVAPAVRALGAARPAIMPMSAYRALSDQAAASASVQLAAPSPAASEAWPSPTPEPAPASGSPSELPARRKIRSLRPAVMPASAWRARPGTAREVVAVPPPPEQRPVWRGGTRPAVMPASAWHAANAAAANDLEPDGSSASLEDSSSSLEDSNAAASEHRPTSEAPNTVVSGPGLPERPETESVSNVVSYGGVDSLPLSFAAPGSRLAETQPDAVTAAAEENSLEAPRLPGQIVPRSTWPRANWRELVPLLSEQVAVRRDALGRWIGEIAPGWYARTLESATELRTARRCLARAVLRQRALQRYLSLPRCLALTEEADRFWVWQIVFRVPTLAGTLGKLLDGGDNPAAVADALLEAAIGYLDARENFAEAPEPLPISLQALSSQAGHFVYSGLLPRSDVAPPRPGPDEGAAFREALTKRWPEEPSLDARAVVDELERKAMGRLPGPIVEIIRGVLIRQ